MILLQGPPGPLFRLHPAKTLPSQMEPGLRRSSATALRQLITDKWPPVPLPQQLSNAFEPQNGPSLLSYPSSIFINCNRQTGVPKGTKYFFPDNSKERKKKNAYMLMELLWLKRFICRCALTSHTTINLLCSSNWNLRFCLKAVRSVVSI